MLNKKTILWTIAIIILGLATIYDTLYYLQRRDEKAWEKMLEEKRVEDHQHPELTRIEKLDQMASKEELTIDEIQRRQKILDDLSSQTPQTLTPVSDAERIKRLESMMNQ